jgi:hypothetical protein
MPNQGVRAFMNKPKQKQRQAFLDDIKAVEAKHGLRLAVVQPPPQMVIEPINHENRTTNEVQT